MGKDNVESARVDCLCTLPSMLICGVEFIGDSSDEVQSIPWEIITRIGTR